MRIVSTMSTLLVTALAVPLAGQAPGGRYFVEARAGAAVPTFDIADVAKTGTAFGATAGVRLSPRMTLFAELDRGMHQDKATGSTDITTMHYMAKVGYSLTGRRDRGIEVAVNLGAGAVGFDIEGGPSYTYPAINAGAKITYAFSPAFAFVLSPQGDIAFTKEDELTTTNAWVWPVTVGLRFTF